MLGGGGRASWRRTPRRGEEIADCRIAVTSWRITNVQEVPAQWVDRRPDAPDGSNDDMSTVWELLTD